MEEVANPSEIFLSERSKNTSGSAVVCSLEGTRPLLVEIQALVAPTAFGLPQRNTTGFNHRRLAMLLAVLERRAGLNLGMHDVFVNIAGGLKIEEPAIDLGVACAIASAFKNKPCDEHAVILGEVGLGGEVRAVSQSGKRINEARKLGFTRVIGPAKGFDPEDNKGIATVPVRSVSDAITAVLQ
jgi:DNA repair protein RadA/Sms